MYFNYMSGMYYYYSANTNKFYNFKNRQDIPIHRFIEDLKSGKLTKKLLKAYNNKYVVAVGGGGGLVMANEDNITQESHLTFIPHGLDRDKVVIGTSKSYFISTKEDGEYFLNASKALVTPEGQFEIIPIYPDKLAFRTNLGYFVVVDNTMVKGNSPSIKPEGIFTIVDIPKDR